MPPGRRRNRSPAKGFTLLEVLVALGIAALALAAVTPRLPGVLESVRAAAAAREVVSTLRQARTQAIVGQASALVLFDLDERRYWGVTARSSGALPSSAQLTLVTADTERRGERAAGIRFFPDGSSTGGRLSLEQGAHRYVIEVDWLTGRVVLER